MKTGESIFAKTHAEFLNQLLKKDYKAWMKSGYNLPDGKIIWMIELGPFITAAGWVNELVGRQIREEHVRSKFEYDTHNTYKNSLITGEKFCDADRVIFDIKNKSGQRKYIFRGVFRLNKEKSTVSMNVWDLVKDEYFFG